ncbi:chromate transporter [Chromobacterium alkanivorans]|uniref:chromate transporter n=1 Tax=Chromobacterium TaxID=535 RepID=UPI000652AD26|nr:MULTISPECIES: chromate transporter [Chromobacterium]KMN83450.1 chromate transporter [Chromobacterium sp. LK11]MBN3005015.1 chromate transporter [Chromobacterium alkanivorans]MCS3806034.1 chromate transporter [Chromobacterium alkanivorans]MCS3820564.1 chromate transporter [Chromobacterium alkanivorans]MCS3875322.1 chromate transporter [Chromobacterium alkanivorans]
MEPDLRAPSRRDLFTGFFAIGLTGFGGVLPQAHRMMVLRRRWLSEADFAVVLGLGQVLPGPNIVNVAVAVGSRFHGASGALAAVAGLLLAPMVIVLLLASFYGHYRQLPLVQNVLHGLASAAAGLIAAMGLRLLARIERKPWCVLVAALTFCALGVLQLPLLWSLALLAPVAVGLAWRDRPKEGA